MSFKPFLTFSDNKWILLFFIQLFVRTLIQKHFRRILAMQTAGRTTIPLSALVATKHSYR
jgi:hypothetical protein